MKTRRRADSASLNPGGHKGVVSSVDRRFELIQGSGRVVEWIRIRSRTPNKYQNADTNRRCRGLVFIPPLIGGDTVQQIRLFRTLCRNRFDLVTFNYAGHGRSTGRFSLNRSLEDTRRIFDRVREISAKEQIPIYGAAACYAAIPLIDSCKSSPSESGSTFGTISGIVLINAIFDLAPFSFLRSFGNYYRTRRSIHYPRKGVMEAFQRFMETLFPGVGIGIGHFGRLKRKQTRLLKTVAESMVFNPLEQVRINDIPVLCVYAKQDPILQLHDPAVGEQYERRIQRVCPNIRFFPVNADHFMAEFGLRTRIIGMVQEFFNRSRST